MNAVNLTRNSETYGPNYARVERDEDGERRYSADDVLTLGLQPNDIGVLRFAFDGLASCVGLGSNFGSMCERLAAQTRRYQWDAVTKRILRKWRFVCSHDRPGPETLGASLITREVTGLAPPRASPRSRTEGLRETITHRIVEGVCATCAMPMARRATTDKPQPRGLDPETVRPHASETTHVPRMCRCTWEPGERPCPCDVELNAVEAWACWSNHGDDKLGRQVALHRRALARTEDKDVGVLYRAYSLGVPAEVGHLLTGLGGSEIIALAPDTARVESHRAKLERERQGRVEPWTAAFDLLVRGHADESLRDGETREARAARVAVAKAAREGALKVVRQQAWEILINASKPFLRALREVRREAELETRPAVVAWAGPAPEGE
jgi:hypothetical protein